MRARSRRHSSACQADAVGSGAADRVEVLAARPRREHLRAVQGVAVKQPGQVAHGGQPAALPGRAHRVRRLGAGSQIRGQRRQPRLGQRLLHDAEQRPHRALGQPRVLGGVDPGGGGHRVGDEAVRGGELDVGADPVGAAGAGAEHRGHPLGQPALHAARGDGDDLGRERVGRALGEERGKGVGEGVGADGTVDMKHGSDRVSTGPAGPHGRDPRESANSLCQLLAFRHSVSYSAEDPHWSHPYDEHLPHLSHDQDGAPRPAPISACGRAAWAAPATRCAGPPRRGRRSSRPPGPPILMPLLRGAQADECLRIPDSKQGRPKGRLFCAQTAFTIDWRPPCSHPSPPAL